MIDNHDAVLKSLVAFLCANVPMPSRDVARLEQHLKEGTIPSYLGMEFHTNVGDSCQLYVDVVGADSEPYGTTRIEDEAGNYWHAHRIQARVSWPTYGFDDVATCQRRLALMVEVTRFAAEVERTFPAVFHRLDRTAEQAAADKKRAEEIRARQRVVDLVTANAKGMKVGQERRVEGGVPDFAGPIDVERREGGRTFKYRAVDSNDGSFYFKRMA